MTKLKQKELDKIKDVTVEDGLFELTYEDDFENLLSDDAITPEWIAENAFWLQLEGESDEAYALFKKYVALPIDKWKIENLKTTESQKTILHYSQTFEWQKRRLLYLKYQDWYLKKQQEMEHLNSIAMYRTNQAKILQNTSQSALALVEKLQQKIDSIEPDEIKVAAIPGFISALSTFVSLAADAEARALAVDKLLQLYGEELSALDLREHIQYIEMNKEELDIDESV